MALKQSHIWLGLKEKYHFKYYLQFLKECEGFPGCVTKIRKKERDETATADEVSENIISITVVIQ